MPRSGEVEVRYVQATGGPVATTVAAADPRMIRGLLHPEFSSAAQYADSIDTEDYSGSVAMVLHMYLYGGDFKDHRPRHLRPRGRGNERGRRGRTEPAERTYDWTRHSMRTRRRERRRVLEAICSAAASRTARRPRPSVRR